MQYQDPDRPEDDDEKQFSNLVAGVSLGGAYLPNSIPTNNLDPLYEEDEALLNRTEAEARKFGFPKDSIPYESLIDPELSLELLRRVVHGALFKVSPGTLCGEILALSLMHNGDSKPDELIREYILLKNWHAEELHISGIENLLTLIESSEVETRLREELVWLHGDKFQDVNEAVNFAGASNVDAGARGRIMCLAYFSNPKIITNRDDADLLLGNISDRQMCGVVKYVMDRERSNIYTTSQEYYRSQDYVQDQDVRRLGELIISFRTKDLPVSFKNIRNMAKHISDSALHSESLKAIAEYLNIFLASKHLDVFNSHRVFIEFAGSLSSNDVVEADLLRLTYLKRLSHTFRVDNRPLLSLMRSMTFKENEIIGYFMYFKEQMKNVDQEMRRYFNSLRDLD